MTYQSRMVKLTGDVDFERFNKSVRSSLPEVFWKYAANFQENTHAEVWNHFLAWVFSCKFVGHLQNTFTWEDLWRAACEASTLSQVWRYKKAKQIPSKPFSSISYIVVIGIF